MFYLIPILVFIIGYAFISLEHKTHINKSAVSLVIAAILWILVTLTSKDSFKLYLTETSAEIFEIVVFLLSAMSLVEILVHYKLFDVIRGKVYKLGLSEKQQFLVISVITFFLSSFIDNLTATIVMIQISRRFFKNENLLIAVSSIIISANAGGAFSPIGDVTTIMLWLAGKFDSSTIIIRGFLPSFVLFIVSTFLLFRKIKDSNFNIREEIVTKLDKTEILIIIVIFLSFISSILFGLINLPPYFSLLLGLGITWILVDIFKKKNICETHLEASIENFIKKTDIASLKFFIGILFSVAALQQFGILEAFSKLLYGEDTSFFRIFIGNIVLGLISPILDNVPLTAMALESLQTSNQSYWVLLALSVGTGGSLLVIGSAAGVIAMGMVKELNFSKYFKIAFIPALLGFISCIATWYIQYILV